MSNDSAQAPRQPGALSWSCPESLVDPDWISDHLDDPEVRVVEIDVSTAAYEEGHIPGATVWNAYTDLRHPDYTPIDSPQLATLLSRSGITPETTVVLYGYGAYLGLWLMTSYCHERALLMDGPRERWERAGMQWSTATAEPIRSRYPLPRRDGNTIASRETVAWSIGSADAAILDVRSDAEYAGERFWPSGGTHDAGRGGHIPGAIHVPFELVRDDNGLLRHPDELQRLFVAAGVQPEREVITYCTIGNRASQVWFALKHVLGYPNVTVYYGSWVEWGKLADTPIET